MTTRSSSTGLFFALASATVFACGGAFAFTACSSTTAAGDAADSGGGTDAAVDARKVVEAGPEVDSGTPLTQAQCEQACAAAHPTSVPKYDAIDTCWAAHCQGPCVDGTGAFDAGDEGGTPSAANDGGNGLCMTQIASGADKACDDCTELNCCPVWKTCYGDMDCVAYNDCIGNCAP